MATKRTFIGNIKGPQGETGATGAQGPVGPGATIEVGTVSTTAYGNTAQVVNSGTETAAVLDFVIPQGKPGEQTTKMGALTLDTITAQSAEYPIPAVGDTGATAFGKIVKFFNDVKTAVNSKINISDIVNNLSTNVAGRPLSAAQGVALKALIDSITVPTRTSQLTNDSGYLTSVPVSSVNGKTGAVSLSASEVGAAPASQTLTLTGIDADGVSHSWTVYGVAI
jgi:hypothetical protein